MVHDVAEWRSLVISSGSYPEDPVFKSRLCELMLQMGVASRHSFVVVATDEPQQWCGEYGRSRSTSLTEHSSSTEHLHTTPAENDGASPSVPMVSETPNGM